MNSPLLIVSGKQTPWNITLQITEPSGSRSTIVLGASLNTSDQTDDLDVPEPPAPPLLPYIRVWFITPFPVPFNRLLQEYKEIHSSCMEWNLSILWVSDSESASHTTISINWDSTQAADSGFTTFLIYDDDAVVANLLTEHSYSFVSDANPHHFQIIGENSSINSIVTQSNLVVLLLLSIGVIIIVFLVVFFMYRRRG